jgi:hypothetical protein
VCCHDQVALETTCNALSIARILEPHVGGVLVADTRNVRAMTHAKVKNDRLDAQLGSHLRTDSQRPHSRRNGYERGCLFLTDAPIAIDSRTPKPKLAISGATAYSSMARRPLPRDIVSPKPSYGWKQATAMSPIATTPTEPAPTCHLRHMPARKAAPSAPIATARTMSQPYCARCELTSRESRIDPAHASPPGHTPHEKPSQHPRAFAEKHELRDLRPWSRVVRHSALIRLLTSALIGVPPDVKRCDTQMERSCAQRTETFCPCVAGGGAAGYPA